MMKTLGSNDSEEQVYEDFRQLIAQKEKQRAEKSGRSAIWRLRARFRRSSERAAELLETRLVLLLAGCLSFVLAAMTVFVMQSPQRDREPSIDSKTSSGAGLALTPPASMHLVSDVKDFAEDRPKADRPAHSFPAESTSETSEAFIIRVGSFRNASNATRVVKSLRQQRLDVKTEVLAGGLHVITLGPFPKKGAAEDAARSVRQAIGLTPQVVRSDGFAVASSNLPE